MSNLSEFYNFQKRKIATLSSLEQFSKKSLSDLLERKETEEQRLLEYRRYVHLDEQVFVVMKQIIDTLSYESLKQITSMLTYALRTICFDRDYQFEMKVDDRRDVKTIDFYLVETIDGETVRSEFDSIGGGIQAIVGFVLQVYFIMSFNQSRVIFCDESFSQLSDKYIPTFMEFMRALSDKRDFIFVLISHDNRFISYADHFYKVEKGQLVGS